MAQALGVKSMVRAREIADVIIGRIEAGEYPVRSLVPGGEIQRQEFKMSVNIQMVVWDILRREKYVEKADVLGLPVRGHYVMWRGNRG